MIEWPARSPDLTPLDFSLWPYLKIKLHQSGRRYENLETLVNEIFYICENLPVTFLLNATRGFYHRLTHCVMVEGGHFEHRLRARAAPL